MYRVLTTIFTVSALALLVAPAFAADNPWENMKLPFESAIIHYDVSGSEKGKETLYIADRGRKQARVTKSSGKVMFMKSSTNTIEIMTPDTIISVDMDKKSGTRATNPQKYMIEEYEKLTPKEKATVQENAKKMGVKGANMMKSMGGEVKLKAGEHLGYTCDIISFMGTTVYQMSGTGIPLKTQGSMMGVKMNTVATAIDKGADPPENVFEVPAGVNVTFSKEQDDMNREMAKSTIDWLKDPEAEKKMTRMEKDIEEAQREAEAERQAAERERASQRSEDEPPQEEEGEMDTGEMMKKGMDALKGLFK